MTHEVRRRLVHASGAVVPLAWAVGRLGWPSLSWTDLRIVMLVGAVIAVTLEAIRLVVGLEWRIFDRLTRGYEEDNVAGYALYVLGGAAAALAFPGHVAAPALFMLTIGDPISGLVGTDELRRVKRPSSMATMFGVSMALAIPFLPAVVAALAAAAATLADGVKPVVGTYVIDDNLTIPVAASATAAVACAALVGCG